MNARRSSIVAMVAVLAGSTGACAARSAPAGGEQRNRVGREELASTNGRTVYEALELLRPSWLTSRGPVSITDRSGSRGGNTEARPNVYMSGSHLGDLDYLKQVYISDVHEVVFWRAGEASARFGMGNPRGVIEIIPRR